MGSLESPGANAHVSFRGTRCLCFSGLGLLFLLEGAQSWASFFQTGSDGYNLYVLKMLAFGDFCFIPFLKGCISMTRSSQGTPALLNPVAQGGISERGSGGPVE